MVERHRFDTHLNRIRDLAGSLVSTSTTTNSLGSTTTAPTVGPSAPPPPLPRLWLAGMRGAKPPVRAYT
ncbi:hypothetical protein RHMOL_Rhmol06G0181100 [Rhododendron molle]|uniref:Uncharacterized protein n=1 Tax=Rhododendron molle TaxID=49168 RepID=A0ACC0NDG0_RHOML|nr:hypothetical protein RHMOL_Rhmol06G0181100 [Rhododendron molle]